MKKLLNTLFVTTQGAYLSKEGETILVTVEKETKLQVPLHTLGGIVCFGSVLLSPFLMGSCGEHEISVSFLTEYGKFLASINGRTAGNVLLRREQYRRADESRPTRARGLKLFRNHVPNKGLERENLSDHMTDLELIFSMLGEASTTEIARKKNAQGFEENKNAAQAGGKIAGDARRKLEIKSGSKVVTSRNFLPEEPEQKRIRG